LWYRYQLFATQSQHRWNVVSASILVVGSTMIDLIAYADRLPEAGETLVGAAFRSGFGGKGANQAVAAARFGARVSMVNAVGDDGYGAETIANFEAQNVDTRYVRRVPGSSGVAPIWVDGAGMNRIIIVPGANGLVSAELAVEAVAAIRPAVVVGQHEIPQEVTAAAFVAARAAGAVTVLNPAPAAEIIPGLLAATSWLVPNEHEFALIGGGALDGDEAREDAAIAALSSRLGISLVVTLGSRGAAVLAFGGAVQRVAAPVVTAVDTTGAGDAFVGAFAVGLAEEWTAVDAARLGCAFAADSVTRLGTQSSFADRHRASELFGGIGSRR
jgi:ribokinase